MSKNQNRSTIREVDNISRLFDFEDTLGEGSFACVWTASRKVDGQKFAIKQIQVHPLEKEMAYQEVENLQKVENDHIIKYYASIYDTSESTLNLIMERCKASLRTEIRERIYNRQELLNFIVQINSAFLQLLDKKLMHLDLKPENILISHSNPNYYKICDFGCAQIAIQSKLTKYNTQIFGTFNYLAPENYLDYHGKLTNTSADIWSLGVILYEMIYKKLPLEIGPDGFIMRKEVQEFFEGNESKIVFESGQNAPEDLLRLIKKMLRAKPNNRITWVKLKEDLQSLCNVDEYQFFNVKNIYFKHVKIMSIFLTFIMIIRKNVELNPHLFWKSNSKLLDEFSNTLLHLCYMFCLKFKQIYQYKLKDCLEEEWIRNLEFMQKNIEYEQNAFAIKKKYKLASLADFPYNQILLLQNAKEVKQKLSMHSQFWQTMYDLDIFCQQTIKRGEKKSFFAAGDNLNYGQTLKELDIS